MTFSILLLCSCCCRAIAPCLSFKFLVRPHALPPFFVSVSLLRSALKNVFRSVSACRSLTDNLVLFVFASRSSAARYMEFVFAFVQSRLKRNRKIAEESGYQERSKPAIDNKQTNRMATKTIVGFTVRRVNKTIIQVKVLSISNTS